MFTINTLSPGDYDVKVSAKGFSPTTTQVKLEVGQQQELKIRLEVKTEQINVTINSTDAGLMVNTTSSLLEELSLLVPGNAPAPDFDPTKTDTVVISTDGRLGRGG
ncbi:MAG TPA: carboxypeptidase-like regulatory domain-containing protein, partial [Terriglobales bacterium]